MLKAEIVSVGTELLLGQILDTHAPAMAQILAQCGIACTHRQTVGDNLDRIVETFRLALSRADVVVAIGGLGPTQDDLTRDAIAIALGDTLEEVPEVATRLRRFFEQRGIPMVDSNLRQATKPTCAELIDNPNGTAPGLLARKDGKTVIALPGPKGEFQPMAEGPVRAFLSTLSGGGVIHSRVLRVIGLGESLIEDRVRDLMESDNPTVAPYAHTGEVHLRVTARADSVEQAEALIDPMHAALAARLGEHLYGVGNEDLAEAVLKLATARGMTLSAAESMTGGGLLERLTNVPGYSTTTLGGVVTYTVEAKQALLGLSPQRLKEFGPVSREIAAEMAEAVRRKLGTDFGVSITGNAGPTSDVDGKPVGLVFTGVAGPTGVDVREHRFRGVREDIRRRGGQAALDQLRTALLDLD